MHSCAYLVTGKNGVNSIFRVLKAWRLCLYKVSLFYTKKVASYFQLCWLFISVYFISSVSIALWTVWVHHLDIKIEFKFFLKYINILEINQIKENSSYKLSGFGSLCFKNFLKRRIYNAKIFKQKWYKSWKHPDINPQLLCTLNSPQVTQATLSPRYLLLLIK